MIGDRGTASLRMVGLALLAALLAGCGSSAAKPWRPRLVILLAIDTCRADHLHCYGYPRNTSPNLDRLAAAGTVFENAFSQANESLFSYASIFSGRYPQRLGPLNYDQFWMPPAQPTIATLLAAHGFRNAAFVAGGHLRSEFGFNNGFETYQDKWDFGSFHDTFPPALRWLDALPPQQPAFLLLQGYDVHAAYHKPAPFDHLFDPDYQGIADQIVRQPEASDNIFNGVYFPSMPSVRFFHPNPRGVSSMDPGVFLHLARLKGGIALTRRDIDHLIAHYDGGIAYADVYVGMLMAYLRDRGWQEETLLVVFGDHGEELMEHGFFNHRAYVADASLHVPLILWGGGVARGQRVKSVVELFAVMPTVLEFLGIPPPTNLDCRSLGQPADIAFAEGILPMTTVRTQAARLIFNGSSGTHMPGWDQQRFTLYDIGADGREHVSGSAAEGQQLRRQLADWCARVTGR